MSLPVDIVWHTRAILIALTNPGSVCFTVFDVGLNLGHNTNELYTKSSLQSAKCVYYTSVA